MIPFVIFGFEADPNAVQKPGLIRPERTYCGDTSYVGYHGNMPQKEVKIGNAIISALYSNQDEMAVLNNADFYVCETCGYAEVGKQFVYSIEKEHKMPSGKTCRQNRLQRLSLGYRFATDVFQLHFLTPSLGKEDHEQAISVLNGLLRGICKTLDLEEQDINGCLQCFHNPYT